MLIGTRRGDLGGRSLNLAAAAKSVPAIGLEEMEGRKNCSSSVDLLSGSCVWSPLYKEGRVTAVLLMYNRYVLVLARVCLCLRYAKRGKVR